MNELDRRVAEALDNANENGFTFSDPIEFAQDLIHHSSEFEYRGVDEILPACERAIALKEQSHE
jgi:hypothetical protein